MQVYELTLTLINKGKAYKFNRYISYFFYSFFILRSLLLGHLSIMISKASKIWLRNFSVLRGCPQKSYRIINLAHLPYLSNLKAKYYLSKKIVLHYKNWPPEDSSFVILQDLTLFCFKDKDLLNLHSIYS